MPDDCGPAPAWKQLIGLASPTNDWENPRVTGRKCVGPCLLIPRNKCSLARRALASTTLRHGLVTLGRNWEKGHGLVAKRATLLSVSGHVV